MDQDVAAALAGIRYQLSQLRSALGVQNADEAEAEVADLKSSVTTLGGQVDALTAWAITVSPPFTGGTPPS